MKKQKATGVRERETKRNGSSACVAQKSQAEHYQHRDHQHFMKSHFYGLSFYPKTIQLVSLHLGLIFGSWELPQAVHFVMIAVSVSKNCSKSTITCFNASRESLFHKGLSLTKKKGKDTTKRGREEDG